MEHSPVEDNSSLVGECERRLEDSIRDIVVVGRAGHEWLFREYVKEVFLSMPGLGRRWYECEEQNWRLEDTGVH